MDSATTVIDAHADIEGTLMGKDAQVLGKFRGQIELTGRLILGEGSRVDAQVVADAVEIAGEFKGELKARSLVRPGDGAAWKGPSTRSAWPCAKGPCSTGR